MRLDYHMHTRLTDGFGEPREYARLAVERGLDEICCTDHAPFENRETDWTMKKSDLATYVGWVREAQREFPQLSIKLGLEVDYVPGCERWVRELAAMYPWDFFLGSVHHIGAFPIDRSAEDWQGQDVGVRWCQYFALWSAAAATGLYDSMAHPDLPKKFNFRPAFDPTPLYREALAAVAQANVAIEISTGGLRKPCGEIYPSESFLRIAREFNIPITIGSDAHRPEETGADLDQAISFAKRCGYQQVCRFTQRRREFVPL